MTPSFLTRKEAAGNPCRFTDLTGSDPTAEPVQRPAPDAAPTLLLETFESAAAHPEPRLYYRTPGSPQILFPREEHVLVTRTFSLADIANGDAVAAGARFVREVPTFLVRDALEAERGKTGELAIRVAPQANEQSQQVQTSIEDIRLDMTQAILAQPEVPRDRAASNAAARLIAAFLRGAGVTDATSDAGWGEQRRRQAVDGLRNLIRDKIKSRTQEAVTRLEIQTIPLEPVVYDPEPLDAFNDDYQKNRAFSGWKHSIMPAASFDAKDTEWALAHLFDRDNAIQWWQRLYSNGQAWILHPNGRYFPDFIVIDTDNTHWVVEGKSDREADTVDVQAKKAAAERWARYVTDHGDHGRWRYLLATEHNIRAAAGSWAALLTSVNPTD